MGSHCQSIAPPPPEEVGHPSRLIRSPAKRQAGGRSGLPKLTDAHAASLPRSLRFRRLDAADAVGQGEVGELVGRYGADDQAGGLGRALDLQAGAA